MPGFIKDETATTIAFTGVVPIDKTDFKDFKRRAKTLKWHYYVKH